MINDWQITEAARSLMYIVLHEASRKDLSEDQIRIQLIISIKAELMRRFGNDS